MKIPLDAILFLSGVSCVGKTTTAYEIIRKYPEFRRVSELDIVRTIVRTTLGTLAAKKILTSEQLAKEFGPMFQSLTSNDLETTRRQSEQLLPYVKEIVLRQQRRKIPTILEGAGIIPSTFFPNSNPLPWVTKQMVFINLYLPDESEHIARRRFRIDERHYQESVAETKEIILRARSRKNTELHYETLELGRCFPNVFAMDITNRSPAHIANTIMGQIIRYFDSISDC